MKRLLSGCLGILLALTAAACGNAASGDVADFEERQTAVDNIETEIADLVKQLESGIDCDVEVSGGTANVTIRAPHIEEDDDRLVALKQRIVAEIRAQYSSIDRVSVNSSFGALEKISNPDKSKSGEERRIDNDLKNNEHHEIFDIAAPTL